jgi:hypothetical protein
MYPQQPGPIADVAPGMTVVDSNGAEVGKVEKVKMGDPEAVTTEGQDVGESEGVVRALADSVFGAEPDVPGPLAARLLRIGYVKVDGKGLLQADRYVAADEIAEVADHTIRLTVPKDHLTKEMT